MSYQIIIAKQSSPNYFLTIARLSLFNRFDLINIICNNCYLLITSFIIFTIINRRPNKFFQSYFLVSLICVVLILNICQTDPLGSTHLLLDLVVIVGLAILIFIVCFMFRVLLVLIFCWWISRRSFHLLLGLAWSCYSAYFLLFFLLRVLLVLNFLWTFSLGQSLLLSGVSAGGFFLLWYGVRLFGSFILLTCHFDFAIWDFSILFLLLVLWAFVSYRLSCVWSRLGQFALL